MPESAVCHLAANTSVLELVHGLALYVLFFNAVAVVVCGLVMLVSPRLRQETLNDLRGWWRNRSLRQRGEPEARPRAGPPDAQPSPC